MVNCSNFNCDEHDNDLRADAETKVCDDDPCTVDECCTKEPNSEAPTDETYREWFMRVQYILWTLFFLFVIWITSNVIKNIAPQGNQGEVPKAIWGFAILFFIIISVTKGLMERGTVPRGIGHYIGSNLLYFFNVGVAYIL